MKAILLAAGLGTRLLPLTERVPKCLVPVGGKAVLERNVEWLREHAVRDLAINLHHHAAAVREHFGDGSRLGVSIRWSYESELLGTGGALGPLRGWVAGETFLVVFADNLLDVKVGALVELHRRRRADATMALFEREEVGASGVAVLEGDRLVRFVEKPAPGSLDSRWVNAGLLACEPSLLDYVPDGASDLGKDVLPALLAARRRVIGYRLGADESLGWIDTPADLAALDAVP